MGVSDQLEVGADIGVGVINEGRSSFSTLLIGAKYGLGDARAVSVNLGAPIGDAEDPGLSIGLMNIQQLGGMAGNQHLQIGLLKGFAPAGANIDLLLDPVKEINDKMSIYIDVLLSTNTILYWRLYVYRSSSEFGHYAERYGGDQCRYRSQSLRRHCSQRRYCN